MKFTEEQKELLAFLPTELQNSKEITDSAKLVLGNIIFLYGMEEAQKNGYVYRTNQKMMEETGIKSEHTLIGAVRLLEILEYIKTKRGKRKKASTYELLINCSKTPQNCSNNCSKIETLQNQVLILQKQVVLLQKEIENLKNCSNNCSTDTETDKDIETKNNNNTKDIITKVDVTERKKENITKENVQDVKEKKTSEIEDKKIITEEEMKQEQKPNVIESSEYVLENHYLKLKEPTQKRKEQSPIDTETHETAEVDDYPKEDVTNAPDVTVNEIEQKEPDSLKVDVEIKKSYTQEKDSNNTHKSQHSVDRAFSLTQPSPLSKEVVSLINNIKKNVCAPMEEYRDSHNYHDFRVYHGYFLDSIKLLKKKCTSENVAREEFAEWYNNEAKAFWKECKTLESQNRLYPNAPQSHEMCREVQMYPKAV